MAGDLPHPWGAYARLQSALSRGRRINSRIWGLEEALNRILWFEGPPTAITAPDIDRAEASGARRERSRASLRARHLPLEVESFDDTAAAAEAREVLALVEESAGEQGWALLCAVAEGIEYAEIAAQEGASPGSLRARVLRLRRQCASAVAA